MDEPLETELREVLASRAAAVPADAVDRLRQADYRPREASRDASRRDRRAAAARARWGRGSPRRCS